MSALVRRLWVSAAAALTLALAVPYAAAQDLDVAMREAAKHFQRGVALHNEADYRAALVEFKRAYALSPNSAVLYNVGETEYQLQDYAGALTTFERYLAEAGPADAHRSEVEANVQVLRARVGRLTITTVPKGADVTVDDQSVGRTPLEGPALVVGVGHRKVTASMPGRPAVTRFVDVAAEDNVSVTLQLPQPVDTAPTSASLQQATSDNKRTPGSSGSALRTVGWITGATLTAGAITFGLLAVKESNDLKNARSTFPTPSGTLTHDANLVTTYAVIADSLTAAAVVVGGATLLSALWPSSSSPTSPRSGALVPVRLGIGLGSASLQATF